MNILKKILIILMIGLIILPVSAFADTKDYNSLNLDGALTEEEIEHDFSNYSENDDQITIYLFRGKGCAYCRAFLNFINSIVPEYGQYFKVESYEVWYDENNSSLLDGVSNFLEKPASGVPYIVIGDKVFAGYSENYDEDIKTAIKELYDTKKEDRYDVMKEYNNSITTYKENNSSNATSIVINIIITLLVGTVISIFMSLKIANLESRIKELEGKE